MPATKPLPLESSNNDLGYKTISDRQTPELVFAFVEPIGGGAKKAVESLVATLSGPTYKYCINEIPVSDIIKSESDKLQLDQHDLHEELKELGPNVSEEAKRIDTLQQLGNQLRAKKGEDFLAKKIIQKIATYRHKNKGYEQAGQASAIVPKPLRVAHIIKSIKNKEELRLLKAVYGNLFFLVGVSGNYERRLANYKPRVTHAPKPEQKRIEKEFNILSKIDQYEGIDNGQQVRKVFHKSDLFLKSEEKSIDEKIASFLELLFGLTITSPTIDERMIFDAYAASLRSTCLSRQVGAAISDTNNELVSVGWNDIPAYGGGLATDLKSSEKSALCKSVGECRSTIEINELLSKLHSELDLSKQLLKKAKIEAVKKALLKAGISELIEFSRAIHAEMEALLSAARTGKHGLRGGTLYVTTYPCENCAKHIITAGITRVVYIEPYPKSRAKAFFSEFIVDEDQDNNEKENKVIFSPFVGISPQAYSLLYKMSFERKQDSGKVFVASREPMPITGVFLDSYTIYEGQIAMEVGSE